MGKGRLSGAVMASVVAGVTLLSLVIAPLQVEASVFGVFIAARKSAQAFSSREPWP